MRMIIVILAVSAFLYYGIRDVVESIKMERVKSNLGELIILSKSLSRLINETQKEREISTAFIASRGTKFKTTLSTQRMETDKKIKAYLEVLKTIDLAEYDPELKEEIDMLNGFLEELPKIREEVNNLTINEKEEIKWYTQMNNTILKIIELTIKLIGLTARLAPNEVIAKYLVVYYNFLKEKEEVGIKRAYACETKFKVKEGIFTKVMKGVSTLIQFSDILFGVANGIKTGKKMFDAMKKKKYPIINSFRKR